VVIYLLAILIMPSYWIYVTIFFGIVLGVLYAAQKYILAKLEKNEILEHFVDKFRFNFIILVQESFFQQKCQVGSRRECGSAV